MKMTVFKVSDSQVKMPNHKDKTLLDVKTSYISETLDSEDIEDLFDLIDFLVVRLVDSESERFRSNY